MLPQLIKLKGAALNLLFPRFCLGCGKDGDFICESCLASLPRIELPVCPLCGLPQATNQLCHNCTEWQANIDGIRSPFRFEGVIRESVHQLKYHNLRSIADTLAQFMSDYLQNNPIVADVIIPVPLHPKRLQERGYNQSELLSNELSRLTHIDMDNGSLVREKYSLPQARTASVEERRRNIIGVFGIRGSKIPGGNILLIDDVATSGATLNACASVLKSAGASSVWGLTLAREI